MSEYTTFGNLPACVCVAEWVGQYLRYLEQIGINGRATRLRYRAGGTSGSTHWPGGGGDVVLSRNQDYPTAVRVARQMGADAAWHRTPGQGFIHHVHFVLTGCPHNAGGAYQIAAVRAGFNGLGTNGRGGADDGPRPLSGRTWREGIAWARAQSEKEPLPREDTPMIFVTGDNYHVFACNGGWVEVKPITTAKGQPNSEFENLVARFGQPIWVDPNTLSNLIADSRGNANSEILAAVREIAARA